MPAKKKEDLTPDELTGEALKEAEGEAEPEKEAKPKKEKAAKVAVKKEEFVIVSGGGKGRRRILKSEYLKGLKK